MDNQANQVWVQVHAELGDGAGDTSLVLKAGHGARLTVPCKLTRATGLREASELLRATAVTGDTVTVERGVEGTTREVHAADSWLYVVLTAGGVKEVQDAVPTHAALTTGTHGAGAEVLLHSNSSIPWNSRKIATSVLSPVSVDGFTTVIPSGGDVAANGWVFNMYVAATINHQAGLYTIAGYNNPAKTGKLFKFETIFLNAHITDVETYTLMIHHNTIPPTMTKRHIGWTTVNARLWATSGDDTAQETTDTGVDLVAGINNVMAEVILDPGVDVKFYLDGVLVATHTTRVPGTDTEWLVFNAAVKTLANTTKRLQLGRIVINQDI